jgi:sigma-B regulation protein RsbU (phosphoserine phosphatase)
LRSNGDRRVDEVEQNGVFLGFLEGLKYTELEERLQARDRFLLYTDGLTEASGADDDFFGIERLKATVRQNAGLDADSLADDLLTTVEQWSGRALGDDVTLVVVDWCRAAGTRSTPRSPDPHHH